MTQKERWKMITSDDRLPRRYWVSDCGRIANSTGLIMKTHPNGKSKYIVIQFGVNGKKIQKYVHRLVLQEFKPQPDNRLLARHMNDDKSNNRLSNLKWGTHKDNGEDEVRAGKTLCGERNKHAKLTKEIVKEIRHDYKIKPATTNRSLAKEYNVGKSAIQDIIARKTWKHI